MILLLCYTNIPILTVDDARPLSSRPLLRARRQLSRARAGEMGPAPGSSELSKGTLRGA